jgi:mRNA-capping enzyme
MIAKKVAIGLVIDCTSLDLAKFQNDINDKGENDSIRYFHNTEEWEDFGIDYYRLSPSSKEEALIPSKETIDKFNSLCSDHWKQNPTLHITVFDSRGGHGVASFLAATYLCKQKRAPVHAALSSVERSFLGPNDTGPPGLFDIDLIRELQTLYQGKTEIILKVKEIPKWWFHDDSVQKEEEKISPYQESCSNSTGTKRKPLDTTYEAVKKIKPSTDNMSTVLEQLSPQSRRYDRATNVLQQMLGSDFDQSTKRIRDRQHFQLTKENIKTKFGHKNYKVSWRSVGREGLLLILSDGVFFIESKEGTSKISISAIKGQLYFPEPQHVKKLQHRTLLNVNLVTDRESNREVKRMYISDILVHMGGILIRKPFNQRIKFIIDGLIIPRKKSAGIWDYNKECIKFRAREFFDIEKTAFVMNDVTQGIGHATDGVCFIPAQDKYFGDPVLSWKSSEEGSDDLLRHVAKLPLSK